MKRRSSLDVINGCAIDNDNTHAHHQLISVDNNTIHYTVFHAPMGMKQQDLVIPDKFVETMCDRTPDSPEEKKALISMYGHFLRSIRPYNKDQGFELNKPAKALTLDIRYDSHYRMLDFSMRPTVACMKQKMTYCDADLSVAKKHPSAALVACHSFALANDGRKHQKNERMPFQHVVSTITNIIQTQQAKVAFRENMDCVFKLGEKSVQVGFDEMQESMHISMSEWIKRYAARYGSVLKYNSRSSKHDMPSNALVPMTATRKDIDYLNIFVTAEFLKNDGVNPLPEGVPLAVANYKRHVATWQKMGMMS